MLKSVLRRLLRACSIIIVSTDHRGARYLDHPPQTAFDEVLLRLYPSLEALHCIQVGAHDGKRFDPIFRYLVRHRWHAILIEPVPIYFEALSARYADHSRLVLLPVAVDVTSGSRSIFHVRSDAATELPDWLHGLASFNREHVAKGVRHLGLPESAIVETIAPTLSWDQVWARLPSPHCDLLVIDTEGYDLPLLRAADLGRRRPRIVHFEHQHLTPSDRLAFYGELIALGYELATDPNDTTAWLPSS